MGRAMTTPQNAPVRKKQKIRRTKQLAAWRAKKAAAAGGEPAKAAPKAAAPKAAAPKAAAPKAAAPKAAAPKAAATK